MPRSCGGRHVVVPVPLGCCPDAPRCLLCPPPPRAPRPETVAALVAHYAEERARDGDTLRVGFFGGSPPDDALLDALGGLPFVARVRPDLLTRAEAARLAVRGAVGLELDALTLDDRALRGAGRRYRSSLVLEQIEGLPRLGVQVGIVLAPGLPGTSHETAVRDATLVAGGVDFARLHPVLVLADAGLRELHMDGRYVPLELGQAVTTCRAMMDLLEGAGVEVIRVGLQPKPDGYGRAVAGPRHPSLRQLVEARRTLEILDRLLSDAPRGAQIVVRCAPADETRTRGPFNQHVRTLRADHGLASLEVEPDPGLERGEWRVQHRSTEGGA